MTKRISPLESSREIELALRISSNSKKITYNMYSCAISGMSREMMEMDDRDSVECQNWEKKGRKCHF